MDINGLNKAQEKAVKHTDGMLLIIAGAGSGKTRVLTHRIAYLIEKCDVAPENILAITFTNKAAGEMKERVMDITREGHRVWVSTFHSMCVRILKRFADRIGYGNDFTVYDMDDVKSSIREIFKKNNINKELLKESDVIKKISRAKDNLQTPKDMLEETFDIRDKKIAEIYMEYQKNLKKNNAMDFDDLIFNTVILLEKDREVLEYYANLFKYIMVDEYQDTNNIQFRLVKMLASKWKNLCVVGDDDQSIYRFRGANIENILAFDRLFKAVSVIKLEENYRSTKNILNAANSVIEKNTKRKQKRLYTSNEDGEKVELWLFDDAYREAEKISDDISLKVRDGFDYKDIAILYRTNAQSRLIEERLFKDNIPYKVFGGLNFYQRKEIKDIIAYLKTIANSADGQAIKRIINYPKRGIGATTLDKIEVFSDEANITFWEAIQRANEIKGISSATLKKLESFSMSIFRLKSMLEYASIEEVVNTLLEDVRYIETLSSDFTDDQLKDKKNNIDEFINKIIDFEENFKNEEKDYMLPLNVFLEEVSLVADVVTDDDMTERVSLMTLHSAKGLEFPIVYLAGMEDGIFPSFMSLSEDGGLEEERRLCYVGITRAKKKLILTYAKSRMVNGDRRESKLSRFVSEIDEANIETHNMSMNGCDLITESKKTSKFDFRKKGQFAYNAYASVNQKKIDVPERKEKGIAIEKRIEVTRKNVDIQKRFAPFKKEEKAPFEIGDRVNNERFGNGVIKEVQDMVKDYLLTIEFEDGSKKKMLAGFINLKKI